MRSPPVLFSLAAAACVLAASLPGAASSEHCVFQCLHETEWGAKDREQHPYHDTERMASEQTIASHGSRSCGVEKQLERTGMCGSCTSVDCVAKARHDCSLSGRGKQRKGAAAAAAAAVLRGAPAPPLPPMLDPHGTPCDSRYVQLDGAFIDGVFPAFPTDISDVQGSTLLLEEEAAKGGEKDGDTDGGKDGGEGREGQGGAARREGRLQRLRTRVGRPRASSRRKLLGGGGGDGPWWLPPGLQTMEDPKGKKEKTGTFAMTPDWDKGKANREAPNDWGLAPPVAAVTASTPVLRHGGH